jgi:hypothetical protein
VLFFDGKNQKSCLQLFVCIHFLWHSWFSILFLRSINFILATKMNSLSALRLLSSNRILLRSFYTFLSLKERRTGKKKERKYSKVNIINVPCIQADKHILFFTKFVKTFLLWINTFSLYYCVSISLSRLKVLRLRLTLLWLCIQIAWIIRTMYFLF